MQAVFQSEAVQGGGEAGEDGDELEPVLAAAFVGGKLLQFGDEGGSAFVESGEALVGSERAGFDGDAARGKPAMAAARRREFSGRSSMASPSRWSAPSWTKGARAR
ncbi:MAG: hypothetical protein ACLQKA_21490 [Bryobacteraceae bacterium]